MLQNGLFVPNVDILKTKTILLNLNIRGYIYHLLYDLLNHID